MRSLLVLAAFLFWQSTLLAQSAKGGQLVRELLELTSARQQYQQMLMGMGQKVQGSFTLSLAQALKDRPVDQTQKTKAKAILDKHHQEFIKNLQQALQKTLSWENMIKDVYIPIYLKNFTETELQDILTFYQSKTGRKFATKAPELLMEVSKEVNKGYANKIKASTDKLTDEQVRKITAEIDSLRSGTTKK